MNKKYCVHFMMYFITFSVQDGNHISEKYSVAGTLQNSITGKTRRQILLGKMRHFAQPTGYSSVHSGGSGFTALCRTTYGLSF